MYLSHSKERDKASKTKTKDKNDSREDDLQFDSRTFEEKEEAVQKAKNYMLRVISSCKTTTEVESEFPIVKEIFQLKHIGWEKLGTSQVKLVMEINPKAYISNNFGNLMLAGQAAFVGDRNSNVLFRTANIGGDAVGVLMEAQSITPNHPQGGPPKSSSLAKIMSLIPTNPKLPGPNKYIKGHLLNDNLGGPGDPANLFPITAQANKEHEQQVESFIKDWVNDKGYHVSYRVSVDNINDQLAMGFINADFSCEAYALDVTGNISNKHFIKTIHSVFGGSAATTIGMPNPGLNSPVIESFWNNKKSKVELSSAHRAGAEPAIIDNNVRNQINFLINTVSEFGLDADIVSIHFLQFMIQGVSKQQRNILINVNYDIDNQDFATCINPIGVWNQAMAPINDRSTELATIFNNLAIDINKGSISLWRGTDLDRSKRTENRRIIIDAIKNNSKYKV
ncbi:DNA/RNA non-specific endonuclease [Zooshikella marina]|uniref:DNA/RNA non-specific endonuclease n=1 Tax=Zooshikella ganghwensis TaxID=202772 RepID=UPI001BB02C97|nr:DNA/RNA non-specific endonuclease [Zooshikella ganghwensis]MBU2707553.1 DNA/RNA non-specific endonuclease [Zooshikella ganghwensis]